MNADHVALEIGAGGAVSQLELAGLPLEIEAITLILGSDSGVRIDGELKFPEILGGLSVKVTTLQVTRQKGIDFAAALYIEKVKLSAGWSLEDIEFSYNSLDDLMGGEATLKIPSLNIKASAELLMGDLNRVGIDVSGIEIPIGNTPFLLIRVFGKIDHIASSDPNPLTITAGIGLAGGGVIPVPPDNKIYLISADPLQMEVDLGGKVTLCGKLNLLAPKGRYRIRPAGIFLHLQRL